MKKLALALFVAIAFGTGFSTVASGQYQLEEAFKAAALPADAKGRWVVKTDVNIYKLDGTMKFEASGNLDLKGNVLEGHLGLRPPGGALINGNTLYFYVTKPSPATMRVRHDIAGKPFLGRPAEIVKLENRYRAPFLRGTVIWDGEECTFSIFFSPMQTTEKPKPVFSDPDPIPSAQKAIGARYQVRGRVVVANAEDGLGDKTCEIIGEVGIKRLRNEKGVKVSEKTKRLFWIVPQDVIKGMEFKFPDNLFFDVYDDDQSQWRLEGRFFDNDLDSADDEMWPSQEDALRFNFRTMAGKGEFNYPGDRDSESVEVYITVTKVSDLYKKP